MTDVPADDGAGDELDGVYAREAPQHAVAQEPAKTDFEAWHHPRKQYVRIHQWCAAVRTLIPELGLGVDPFRYLTLPGNELLDIRALHGVCQGAGVKLRYLGFNSVGLGTPGQAELALSQSEVHALSHVDGFSRVMEDRLEAIANERSPVFAQARQTGPFHAINIDLCDSIAFREIGGRRGSSLAAVAKLLELQAQSTTPWLLFITTKAQPGLVADFARDGFMRALDANTAASSEFRHELASLIEGNVDQLDGDLAAAWNGQDPRFLRLFCAGLGKWLLALLSAAAPPRELILLSSCYYQSGPDGPDMLSLAFRCNTSVQPLADRFAILPAAAPAQPFSETEVAIRLAARIAETFDLDGMLAGDADLCDKLIAQAGRLLATARYETAAYEVWARGLLAQPAS
jgi:hypothetical protein